ncbi:flagellar biosynthetic protein FliO [Clostridium sp. SM-530-WT-3G]|uniref:flagellar biosynthetic protein FliO n=1 Tax=Clostridium sp. SM-530-WT-3G TaxID=2725303 RepID=UPI00145E1358|nr:flagellar biosynthetic protein FliO [Clostridium sp. SM-530-WT-3G]NME82760.1 flagellar formation protein [Clostridium sp. SM-530-WT-3G]
MNFEFFKMIMQLIIALAITLGIMFLSYKILGNKVNGINKNKYVKVLERTQITKENSILVIKTGKKGYVVASTAGHIEKLSELSEEEIKEIEENKRLYNEEVLDGYNKLISFSKDNALKVFKKIKSKEETNEEK